MHMSDMHKPTSGFIDYPAPKAYDVPFRAPPPGNNPVLKGVLLEYLSTLVAAVPLVQSILWSNAGFASLRNVKEIDDVEFRYNPTVIPLARPSDSAPANYTDASNLGALPDSGANGRFHSIKDFHDAYLTGALTPSDVVEHLLPLIRRDVAQRTPCSTAFMDSKVELIRKTAEASTQRYKQGQPLGVLDGVPFGVKDDVQVKGYKRYIGARHDVSNGGTGETSWCVRMLEKEGAILVGTLTMHELGMDTNNNNPIWGTPVNPYNTSYYTGGSSGGPASAVSHGLIPFAIGSDGGGSIRIPSSYCGLYGLKPSHARVSLSPMPDAGSSTTTVHGPLASSMSDLELSYRVLAQPDPSVFPSSHFAAPRKHTGPRPKVLGIYKTWIDRADPAVQEATYSAVRYFESELGYEIVDITIPLTTDGQLAHAMTIMAEGATSYKHSVYDLSAPNRVLLSVGRQTPASDFILAQRVRNMHMQHLSHLFQKHPGLVIVTPTTPNVGWPIDPSELSHGLSDANMQLRTMEYVWLANFTGVPCIQFPVSFVRGVKGEGKVPIGLSGHGEWGSEDALIEFGYDGERYLHEGLKGGRVMPGAWVDVLKKK
ncbi:hypothetical protein GMOD_00001211 [Pyrenophora seminiperda CCB06]|uniref:Amidase domain-containing protein n=1 Tax=Pyrenophora seminiperda CCB06 TaxID=1302712 RepID=A0A3M7LYI8_9PLEO|nr:hypothetical protein GMOD_00001211 [Pyrenophora seminiperda CCB06]